ncbi:MAG: triple tyrosine motif-containing protein [Bacteroidota bacterium]
MYVLSSYGSIDIFSTITGSIVRRIEKPEGQESNWFMDIILTQNHIWLNGFKGVWVFDRRHNKFILTIEKKNSTNDPVITKKIFKDYNGNVWTFDSGGSAIIYNDDLSIQNPGGQLLGDESFINNLQINDVASIGKDTVFLATSKGILACSHSNYRNIAITHNPINYKLFINAPIEAMCKAGNFLYIATNALYQISLKTNEILEYRDRYVISQSDWFSSAQTLYSDQADLLWLGGRNGLSYFNIGDKAFTSYYRDKEANLGLEHVFFVSFYDTHSYYACCQNGLYKINERSEILEIDKNVWYNYLFKTGTDTYIASELKGIKILKNDILYDIDNIYTELGPYGRCSLNSHVYLNDSIIVLGTESFNGVLIWNRKKKTVKNITNTSSLAGLSSNVVNTVSRHNDSSVIVLSDKSLAVLNVYTNNIQNYIIKQEGNKEAVGILFDILVKRKFNLIAAYGVGVIKTDQNYKILGTYSTQNGLSNNGVYKLFTVSDSIILVTTNHGINLINLNTDKISNYTSYDGLHSDIFEEACGVNMNNTILAGGVKGFTKIIPEKIKVNRTPPVLFIARILCKYPEMEQDSINVLSKKFTINNNILQTSIYFAGINWRNPERTTFAYRILEQSEAWINLNTQNFVTLIGLSPGTYHLQVKAANEDGVWSEPKELVLKFLPKWYQTWWFKLLVLLTTAGIIYAFYRYRIRQIKKQHEIRKNIATDLHDDLGSTLNSVKVFTNLAISGVKQQESLQQVKYNLTEATMSLRDMIWVLDDSLDTVDELINRLRQFAIPVAIASNIEAIIETDKEINARQLTKEEKRNLFLICKEAINNSIKYSGASRVDITITASGKKVRIVVTDNGKGFNVNEVKKGYGLKNMQYRAAQIKYLVSLNSELNKGTEIIIQPG